MSSADAVIASVTPTVEVAVETLSRLDELQRELDKVREELDVIRRRDDSLQFSMRRMDEELRLAARLQQDFLPKKMPRVGNVRFQTLFRPAAHVSGDLYDVMRLDESNVGFYMADAVGHGMPAALLSMFLKTALVTKEINASGYRLLEPAQTMARLNDALVEQNLSQATFATALYGRVNIRTLELTFARGGHPSPVVLTRDGELRAIEADGPLLGIFPGETFQQTTVQLAPGDRVFIYSDGIEWAFSDDPAPDSDRWRQNLIARKAMTTEQLLGEFGQDVDRTQKKDDLTVIAIDVEAS
jgi:serine phosphatase RsbU (regulator of sigma subunit)